MKSKKSIRLYANENFPRPVVEHLRNSGYDVLTIQEQGHASEAMADEEVLNRAINDERAVITLNRRDFIRLHEHHPEHHGIIVCSVNEDFQRQAGLIDQAIQSTIKRHKSMTKQLIRVHR